VHTCSHKLCSACVATTLRRLKRSSKARRRHNRSGARHIQHEPWCWRASGFHAVQASALMLRSHAERLRPVAHGTWHAAIRC
jgi:hypothetical protein